MQCPVCENTKLAIAERQGVEIDYCPDCRGVWLDRGELDKIIERSAEDQPESSGGSDHGDRDRGDLGDKFKGKGKKHKRKSMLSELFDF